MILDKERPYRPIQKFQNNVSRVATGKEILDSKLDGL